MINVLPYDMARMLVNATCSTSNIRAEHRKAVLDEVIQATVDVTTYGCGLSLVGMILGPVFVYSVGGLASTFGLLALPSLDSIGGARTVGALVAVSMLVVPRILRAVARLFHEMHWIMQPAHMQALQLQSRVNWLTVYTVAAVGVASLAITAYN